MILSRFIAIAMILTCVRGDEDYPLEEIMFDVGTGMAVAACEENVECSSLMSTVTMLALVLALVSWCLCPGEIDDYEEYNNRKSFKKHASENVRRLIFRKKLWK